VPHYVDNVWAFVPSLNGTSKDEAGIKRLRGVLKQIFDKMGIRTHCFLDGVKFSDLGLEWSLTGTPSVALSWHRLILADRILDAYELGVAANNLDEGLADSARGLFKWASGALPALKPYTSALAAWGHPSEKRIEAVRTLRAILHHGVRGSDGSMTLELLPHSLPGAPIDMLFRTDASTVAGYGVVCPTKRTYFSQMWTRAEIEAFSRGRDNASSTFAEALAMLRASEAHLARGLNMAETDSSPSRTRGSADGQRFLKSISSSASSACWPPPAGLTS
jgi:hypothetical protein